MSTYLIAYDLKKPEISMDYQSLHKAISRIALWAKPLESLWLVASDSTATQIRDFLLRYIDSNDKLFVVKLDVSDWATKGIPKAVTDWMNNCSL